MNTAIHDQYRGMGQSGAQIGHTVAGTVLGTAAMVDPEPISKAVLAVASVIQNFFFQPDLNKIATTQIVNKAEGFLQQNLAAWQALPAADKNVATQQQALANFDNVWQQVVQACTGTGQYGSAGQNCVSDRQQGACHYTNAGQCWNWFVGYRDPIANDPQVAANAATAAASSPVTSALSQVTGLNISPELLVGVGLLALAVVAFS